MAADPKTSAGARAERKAFRNYLRRQIASAGLGAESGHKVLQWVMERQSRYDRKAGGLGK